MKCTCGCGGETRTARHTDKRNGQIKGQSLKWINHHHVRLTSPPYRINSMTGCWEWQRYVAPNGYGITCLDGKRMLAHRVHYEKHLGAIPANKQIDHLCRVRRCVNFDHMEVVTQKENIRRGLVTKLTVQKVEKIKRGLKTAPRGWQKKEAAKLGIPPGTICAIKGGKSWVDVKPQPEEKSK